MVDGESGHPQIHWHRLSVAEVFEKICSDFQGLTEQDVAERLQEFGRNCLPERRPPGGLVIFLHQFLSPLIYILLVAGSVSLLIGELTDALFIFAVILLNAGLGTFQEWKAEKSAAALQSLLRIQARVRRGGRDRNIPAEELVPGDIVLLESGSRVPADLRLVKIRSLAIDESLLTGESQAVEKDFRPLEADAILAERRNMVFAGSTVAGGRGLGVVVATGLQTELGQIASAVTEAEVAKPPLVIRMERFSRQISFVVLAFVILLALVSLSRGVPYLDVFLMAVALAVSSIPEGLPVAMTVALSIATTRMARRNVIVRKLTAVEALGSCTCIASDKTGTLTVNRQTVKVVSLPDGRLYAVTGQGYSGEGEVTTPDGNEPSPEAHACLVRLASAVALCNEARLEEREGSWEGSWEYDGDAVDVALLALAYKLGMSPDALRAAAEQVAEIPFESEHRYAAVFYRDGTETGVAVKGAAEAVLSFCTGVQSPDGDRLLVPGEIAQQAMALAEGGYRVIAVACGRLPGEVDPSGVDAMAMPELTLLGLVGLIDPLRPEVKSAVNRCKRAGVRVVMITGDHPATALSIACELGIAAGRDDLVTGDELDRIGSSTVPQYLEEVRRASVFSRVAPLQKLDIVEALGMLGHFVAVTGDGVNDAPALRRANIGVAMGSGTDVAKDTASIIVTDDNFASIEGGVEEGRFAFDNIRKVVYLLISTGGAEIVLFCLALLTELPLPLVAVQLLWLNLVTNGIQDVALAFEGGEPEVMSRPPRPPSEGIFNRLMIEQTILSGLCMGGLAFGHWQWLLAEGWGEAAARNSTLLLMVLLENVHVFNCRSERVSAFRVPLRRNWLLVGGVVMAQGVHILVMYVPLMQGVLGVTPVSFSHWLTLVLLAVPLVVVMELYKLYQSRCRRQG